MISPNPRANAGPDPNITPEEKLLREREDANYKMWTRRRIACWLTFGVFCILVFTVGMPTWLGLPILLVFAGWGLWINSERPRREQIATARRNRDPEWIAEQARRAAEEKARQERHMRDFFRQWTADIEKYSQYGDSAVNQAMTNSIEAFFPVPAGQMHDYQVVWNTNDRQPDGTIRFEFLRHQVIFTPAELQRQQLAEQTRQINDAAFWNSVFTEYTIRHQGNRIVNAINHR